MGEIAFVCVFSLNNSSREINSVRLSCACNLRIQKSFQAVDLNVSVTNECHVEQKAKVTG